MARWGWCLAGLLVACGSSGTASNATSDGVGGQSGASGGASGAADAEPRCTSRSTAECQVRALGPKDHAGERLTILGDDVYWIAFTTDRILTKTSLNDGASVDVPKAASGLALTATSDMSAITNDGTDVFIVNQLHPARAVLRYMPGPGAWSAGDLLMDVGGTDDVLIVNGTGYARVPDWVVSFSPSALTPTAKWHRPYPAGVSAIATDGTALFVLISEASGSWAISRLDGDVETPLGELTKSPYDPRTAIAVTSSFLYVTTDTQIVKFPHTGGQGALAFDDAPNHPHQLLSDATSLYFDDETGLHAVDPSTGGVTDLASFPEFPQGGTHRTVEELAQTAADLVWVGADGVSKVRK